MADAPHAEQLETYSEDFETDDEDMEEVYAADDGTRHSDDTNKFDQVVQALEELMVDQEFQSLRDSFCREHCHIFEATEENKLEYTAVHDSFCQQLEAAMAAHLEDAVPGFDMAWFMDQLEARQGELDAEVFDLLCGLSDFQAFKELMLDYHRAAAAPSAMAAPTATPAAAAAASCSRTQHQPQATGPGVACGNQAAASSRGQEGVLPAAMQLDEQQDGDLHPDQYNSMMPLTKPAAAAAGYVARIEARDAGCMDQ